MTLCDLSKAFDSVCHENLLSKCAKLNTDNFWFSSYLHNRSQYVRSKKKIGGSVCELRGSTGLNSWPYSLLHIYVNDLAEKIDGCFLIQYANDTQFLSADTIDNLNNLIRKA